MCESGPGRAVGGTGAGMVPGAGCPDGPLRLLRAESDVFSLLVHPFFYKNR